MRFFSYVVVFMLVTSQVFAFDLKLDEAWVAKLGALCDAGRFGSRMVAEPICTELAALVGKAQADEAAARKKQEPESKKPD